MTEVSFLGGLSKSDYRKRVYYLWYTFNKSYDSCHDSNNKCDNTSSHTPKLILTNSIQTVFKSLSPVRLKWTRVWTRWLADGLLVPRPQMTCTSLFPAMTSFCPTGVADGGELS